MGVVVPHERWLVRYAELVRAELSPHPVFAAGDVDLPEETSSWWAGYLAESLVGRSLYDGDEDPVKNPRIPIGVAEVGDGEATARSLLKNLFGALFEEGARAYVGPVGGGGGAPRRCWNLTSWW